MEDIRKWKKDLGLGFIHMPEKDPLEVALKIGGREFANLTFEEMEDILILLTNYNIYLKRELGDISAAIVFREEQLDLQVAPKASRYGASHAKERRAIVIANNESISKLNKSFIETRVKFEILQPIPDTIKNKIYTLTKIYDRKIRELGNVNRGS